MTIPISYIVNKISLITFSRPNFNKMKNEQLTQSPLLKIKSSKHYKYLDKYYLVRPAPPPQKIVELSFRFKLDEI